MRKILSVDDDDSILRCYKKALDAKGYQAFVTSNPLEVSQILQDHKLDLVMLDICMPKRSGFDIFKELKQKYEHLPVLFVTAYPGSFNMESQEMVDLWQNEFADGITDILYKPFDIDVLYEKVEGLIGPSQTRVE